MRLAAAMALILALVCPALAQQDNGPLLETDFETTETIPGQPLDLRLTVLVPTYMPKPPVWPSFEAPNLLVRLPERSTSPTSQTIEGESWSGVTRRYRISPMVPGRFELPSQTVIVIYADPDTNEPVEVHLSTGAISFSGTIPTGAEQLDPFIAAQSLELSQGIEGKPEKMVLGASVSRTVTAKISGVSPMFLPDLLPATGIEGVAAYPDEPVVEHTEERGEIGGRRIQRVTFVAQSGGSGKVPPISINWYNLQTGTIETATVDGFAIAVEGPSAANLEPLDWRAIISVAFGVLLVSLAVIWLLRRLIPPLLQWKEARHRAWLDSEEHAFSQVRHAVRRRDLSDLLRTIDIWSERVQGVDLRFDPGLQAALTRIGASRYGSGRTAPDPRGEWSDLQRTLTELRRTIDTPEESELQPLNPG